MQTFRIQKLSDNPGSGFDPITLIQSGIGLWNSIKSIFGGQTYGADFAYRKQKIQGWQNQFGLAGTNEKYINPEILGQFAIEDPGKPSQYSFNSGVWQSDVQQYFSAIAGVLKNNPPQNFDGGSSFVSIAQNYINEVNKSGGGLGLPNFSSFGNMSLTTWLIIGAGAYFLFFNKKRK